MNNLIQQKKPFENNNQEVDSDSDEYIDLENIIEEDKNNIFQFHLDMDKLIIKYIGKSSHIPDIIIKENFGPKQNMSLYNCIYSQNELKTTKNISDLFYPIVKFIIKEKILDNDKIIISSFAIKINQPIEYDIEIKEWELFWVKNIYSENYIKTIKINKNINSSNILEKLIELSVN